MIFYSTKTKIFFWIFSATGTSEEWQPTIKRWEWSVNTSHLKVVQIIIKKARKKKNLLFFPYKPEEDLRKSRLKKISKIARKKIQEKKIQEKFHRI